MIVKCSAPIRICDLGGWTDTWFAERGQVLSIAVTPFVHVQVEVRKRNAEDYPVTVFAENYGEFIHVDPASRSWGKHPLIEAAFKPFSIPPGIHLSVTVFSEAPAGASTGTSAAVSVALLGAMDLIGRTGHDSHGIAREAHRLETEVLGLQAGVQDQFASAYGGINFIEIEAYPKATITPLDLDDALLWELEERLLLIYLGKPHHSSAVHETVIDGFVRSPDSRRHLDPLRAAAVHGKQALLNGDLNAFSQAMNDNTEAQRKLHPELVGERAATVFSIGKRFGVMGHKVNGAGGEGGSVTLLLPADTRGKHRLIRAVEDAQPDFRNLPVRIARHGLRRWIASD